MNILRITLLVGSLVALTLAALWSQQPQADPAARVMTDAARSFLKGLDPAQRKKAEFAFDSPERTKWHYYPVTPWPRQGAIIKEMSPAQRKLAHGLLQSALSQRGYQVVEQVMALDGILRDIENTEWAKKYRDPELYYVCIFGEPSLEGRWGWRFEGHHLNLNFVIDRGKIVSMTPSVFGANPALVGSGPHRNLRVLAQEEDQARDLLLALPAALREKAWLDAVGPFDVLSEVTAKARLLPIEGAPVAAMAPAQREMVRKILELYTGKYPAEIAERMLGEVDWDSLHFVWQGGLEPAQPHYYRIQGPRFVVEFCNTQNLGNHVHAVWRSYAGDFGLGK